MRRVRLIQNGLGTVGREVVRLVQSNHERWLDWMGVDISYAAVFDSRGGLVRLDGLSHAELSLALNAKASGRSLAALPNGESTHARDVLGSLSTSSSEKIGEQATSDPVRDVVLIDCAAGDRTYDAISETLVRSGSAVLANKAPLSMGQCEHDWLVEASRWGRLRYEATVGAGLPVISTLRALLAAGDEVREIRACASGTLGYITSELMAGRAYSEAVATAKSRGYTEPDPRDDLSGLDVARKALILARTFGRRLELADIRVEPLMPALDPALSVDDFLAALPEADAAFAEKVERARRSGSSLKYVAAIPAEGEITVGLQEAPVGSQMGSLTGPDNIFVFRTRAYHANPLTVIGPGAGPVVTAMGVVGDILQAARR